MSDANKVQIDLWDGRVGEKWAAMQINLDAMLSVATAQLKTRAKSVSGLRVLDIGCGTGQTCVNWLEGGAEVTGVDVSAPMLAVAAERTHGKAKLIQADASVWKGDAPFDLAVSQFGVMFFSDPNAAFANIAANIRPGGRLLFACWRAPVVNPWATLPVDSVRDLLPEAAPPLPNAPGPFALADKDRLAGIVAGAGFVNIAIDPFDFPVCLATEGGARAAARFALQIGPAAWALTGASDAILSEATKRLEAAFAPHDSHGIVTLAGAIWFVEAVREG